MNLHELLVLLPALMPVLILVIIGMGFCATNRPRVQALRRLTQILGGSVRRFPWIVPQWSGSFEGLPVTITLMPESKHSPRELVISTKQPCAFRLRIVPETWSRRLGRQLGLLRDLRVRDPAFDERFLILTDQPPHAQGFLSDDRIRRAVTSLFDLGMTTLTMDRRGMAAKKSHYPLSDLEPSQLLPVLQHVRQLATR